MRHLIKSGISGWAQMNGWRGDTSINNRVEYDIYFYVGHLCQVLFLCQFLTSEDCVWQPCSREVSCARMGSHIARRSTGNLPAGQRAPRFGFASISISNYVSTEATWHRAVAISDAWSVVVGWFLEAAGTKTLLTNFYPCRHQWSNT